MALSCNKIAMCKQTDFIHVMQMGGLTFQTDDLKSLATGNALFAGVNSSGYGGVLLDADGEKISGLIRIPTNWDRDHDIGIKVVFSSASVTAADKANWKVLYMALTPESTAVAAPVTALDTVIATDTIGDTTAHRLRLSPQGIITGGTIGDNVRYLGLEVELDDLDTACTFYGLEFEYTCKFHTGNQNAGATWAN